MRRLLVTALLLCCVFTSFGQGKQGLYLAVHDDKWMVQHTVSQRETIFLLSRRYHVPPAMLASVNNIGYQTDLSEGSTVYVPLGAFNYLSQAPASSSEAKPIYYKTSVEDNLGRISRRTGVSQRVIQDLNNLPDNSISAGQTLQIGWVMYDATVMNSSAEGAIKSMEKPKLMVKADTLKPAIKTRLDSNSRYKVTLVRKEMKRPDGTVDVYLVKDTVWADTLGLAGRVYMEQTHNELKIAEEKGTVVFYENPGKVASTKVFYGLHNTLPKGTAVRVTNPGSGKFIFIKIVGRMPDTKQYYNAIMAVGMGARTALGVPASEEKVWCELKYVVQ